VYVRPDVNIQKRGKFGESPTLSRNGNIGIDSCSGDCCLYHRFCIRVRNFDRWSPITRLYQ